MAGTFSQLYIQVVFAVKNRACNIHASWEDDLYKYISGIIRNKEQKVLAINGMPDHIHIFINMKPSCCLSDLVREVKKASTEFIRSKNFTSTKFSWQEGYGAFSYSHSQIDSVVKYIMNQKHHHRKLAFREEYLSLLAKFEIEFDDKYVFDWRKED
jgi:putative transposase